MPNTYHPRYGVATGEDNTGRVLTIKYLEPLYATPLAVVPRHSKTTINVGQLTGALTITATLTSCLVDDEITFLFSADGTNRVVTFSTGIASAGTLTVLASKFGSATFRYNGTTFIEIARALTA